MSAELKPKFAIELMARAPRVMLGGSDCCQIVSRAKHSGTAWPEVVESISTDVAKPPPPHSSSASINIYTLYLSSLSEMTNAYIKRVVRCYIYLLLKYGTRWIHSFIEIELVRTIVVTRMYRMSQEEVDRCISRIKIIEKS